MNELSKTLTFVAVALLLTGAAFVGTRDRVVKNAQFNDQGQPFFPDFKDPLACTDLEVVSFDPATATATRFRVMWKDKKWVIPSHYDYPADARDRLSKTAAAVMDLRKDTIRSDKVEDQQAMGVIDPLDSKTTTLEGRGKRVTLRDASEKVLADFIIGNEIKGTEREGGRRRAALCPRARPEADLRRGRQGRPLDAVRRLDRDQPAQGRHQQDPQGGLRQLQDARRSRTPGRPARAGPSAATRSRSPARSRSARGTSRSRRGTPRPAQWNDVRHPAGQEANEDRLRSLTDALGDLKIVGVRPKPPGLTDPNDPKLELTVPIVLSLQNRGFFLPAHGLYSDQGDVHRHDRRRRRLHPPLRRARLRHRRRADAPARPTTAEKKDEPDKAKKDAEQKSKGTQENRFLMVTVSFDPTLIPKPGDEERKGRGQARATSKDFPDDVFAPTPRIPSISPSRRPPRRRPSATRPTTRRSWPTARRR